MYIIFLGEIVYCYFLILVYIKFLFVFVFELIDKFLVVGGYIFIVFKVKIRGEEWRMIFLCLGYKMGYKGRFINIKYLYIK